MQSACSNLHHKISLLGSVHVSALLCQIITNLTSIKERTSLTRDSTGSRGNQLLETGLWKETHVAGWNLWKQQSLCDEHHVFLFIFLHTLLDAQHCTKIKKKTLCQKKGYNTGDRGQVWNARLDPSKVFVNRSDIFFSNGHLLPIKFQGHIWNSSHAAAVV